MKKILVIALAVLGLSACSRSQAPREDVRLKQAWETCIQAAQGAPEKLKACESMPKAAEKAKQDAANERKETIAPAQYQQCIQARKSGNDRAAATVCEKIWQQSHATNP
ncbi:MULTISPECIES: ChiQ/YbfN family lipoprotein [Tenebrionibacter/Tenebrionicola group]|jgi:hypothetical protein|uniref:Lipoprotein n=2 Tax=Tenebrionibacter/Tenebrionicola group TaxID=2969848 RepID=A0A8K0XYE4_9ENTR|nr:MULTISPECIES: ChiQ/YbfN family lipoprotein [Tenebrionibacter/Tenebrionicola group]MBK4714469.1 lipoprotein [Tenebrionibacter intestinalis]MBV4412372.1 lipoprotein [Tenebrionicola larvae]MBV5095477.1 lipoprotein [Tenebrionicola larvae]